jgi:membrane carboxypeptidase/penicillin-binding protein PbpC
LAANIIILDPQTGQILSMVGEPAPGQNPARLPGHPPGSVFTPFIYLTAFTRGMSPATLLWDIPNSSGENLVDFTNPDGKFHGPVRLRTALANDYLIPAIEILDQMGSEQVWQIARQLGLDKFVTPDGLQSLRLPAGGGEVTLLELSQAFGSFANQGVLVGLDPPGDDPEVSPTPLQPLSVLSVEDTNAQVWFDCLGQIGECQTSSRPVISPQLVYLVNHILSDETARWPSLAHPNPLEIGRPAAVKIGQTIEGNDTWSIGYTPNLVIGTWVGNLDPLSQEKVSNNWAAGLWHALMQYAHRDQPVEDWSAPAGITELQVCDPSGMLPTPECPNIVSEVFLSGNEPTVADTLFQIFKVNRETGRLATLLTPAELVDERVFMVVPAEASDWAEQSGIPSLPQSYDIIDFSSPVTSELAITSPQAFASVGGKVSIEGRVSGTDFDYYRLQAGQGLNPSQWVQVSEDAHIPVDDGQLAVWDTSDLSGLYALQLLMVNQDETVQSAFIHVTVDNQAPEVSISFPDVDQIIDLPSTDTLTFLAEAIDDLDIKTFEFLVDGDLLETRTAPPYVVNWSPIPGVHELEVIATDRAGNIAEDQIKFTVQR